MKMIARDDMLEEVEQERIGKIMNVIARADMLKEVEQERIG